MQARGDRDHDIAAWFGVNQGRVAEAKDGKFGALAAAPNNELPPKGPPGVKGRRLRDSVGVALGYFAKGNAQGARECLEKAIANYDANEA
jgi:hypothetical protein